MRCCSDSAMRCCSDSLMQLDAVLQCSLMQCDAMLQCSPVGAISNLRCNHLLLAKLYPCSILPRTHVYGCRTCVRVQNARMHAHGCVHSHMHALMRTRIQAHIHTRTQKRMHTPLLVPPSLSGFWHAGFCLIFFSFLLVGFPTRAAPKRTDPQTPPASSSAKLLCLLPIRSFSLNQYGPHRPRTGSHLLMIFVTSASALLSS